MSLIGSDYLTVALVNQTDFAGNNVNSTAPVQIGSNITIRINVTATPKSVSNVWVAVWQAGNYTSDNFIANTSYTSLSGTIYSFIVPINVSFEARTYNYTLYANDTVNNLVQSETLNFTVNGSMQIKIALSPNLTDAYWTTAVSGLINLSDGTNVSNTLINLYLNSSKITKANGFTSTGAYVYDSDNFTAANGKIGNNIVNDVFDDGTYYYIATNGGLQLIYTRNNSAKLNLSGNFATVSALNNLVYLGNASGVWIFNNDGTLSFNRSYTTQLINASVNDISCRTIGTADYCAVATNAGVSIINYTGNSVVNSTDAYLSRAILITKSNDLVWANTTHLLRKLSVQNIGTSFASDNYTAISNINAIESDSNNIYIGNEDGVHGIGNIHFKDFNNNTYKTTADEISPSTSGLTFYHRLNSNDTATYSVGNQTPIATGGTFVSGKFNNASLFNPTGGYGFSILGGVDPGYKGTVSFWYRPNYNGTVQGADDYMLRIINQTGNANLLQIYTASGSGGQLVFQPYNNAASALQCNTQTNTWNNIIKDRWYHLEFAWDFSTSKCYIFIDGIGKPLQNSGTLSGNRSVIAGSATVSDLVIGSFDYNSANTANGTIDEVKIFNTVQHTSNFTPEGDFRIAGTSNNVTSLSLAADNKTLYVGTNNGNNISGAITEINLTSNTALYNWSNLTSPWLIDYDIRSLSVNANNAISALWSGTLIAGTDNGASVLDNIFTKTDASGNYNYTITSLGQDGTYSVRS